MVQPLARSASVKARLLWGLTVAVAFWLAVGAVAIDLSSTQAAVQDGAVDPTFKTGSGANNTVLAVTLQAHGKILVGGSFSVYNEAARNGVTRLNSDGSTDASFNPGTGVNDGAVYQVVAQTQAAGKILIGGSFTGYNGISRNRIARLNADGSLDTSFNPGTGAGGGIVRTVTVQTDGKILIGGSFTDYNGTTRNRIARLNADGSLDASFNPGTGANQYLEAIAVQTDGKILIGGEFTDYNGTTRNRIARLNADGSLDTSFNPGTGADGGSVRAVEVQAVNGKILIGGSFTDYNGTTRNGIVRLNSDGSLDAGFLTSGINTNAAILAVTVQTDGKILIGGNFSSYNGISRNRIARLNSDGSTDASFSPRSGANGFVYDVVAQSNGKILIGGNFTDYNGTSRNRIARLNADGSLDTSFNPDTDDEGLVEAVTVQTDGKILVVVTEHNVISTRSRIARLNANGSLDTSFNPGTGANARVRTVTVQTDGKILIGGSFTDYNGTSRNGIARLNSDGSLDTSFNPGTGANNLVEAVIVQTDGKILIGGSFTDYNGTSRNQIARLNSDASLDTSFNPGTGVNQYLEAMAIQTDGKILIGGSFTDYNGTSRNGIVRLNSDGSLDTSFNPGTGANGGVVMAVAVQPDGKVLIGGGFESVDTYIRDSIARLENTVKTAAHISLTSSPNPSSVGQNVTFTATATPITATGTIQFTFEGSTSVTSTLVNGVASYVTNTLPLGTTQVRATYSGDATLLPGVSPIYTYTVIATCNPLVVTSSTDNGAASTCGTFSYALLSATSGMTITFTVTNVTFTGVLTPSLQAGVVINGGGDVANGVTLDGGTFIGDGLTLAGGNKLVNLTIKGFGGRGLVVPSGSGSGKTNNKLDRVRVVKT
jgi:uncharacterized delta-60 repeat protein